MQRLIVCLCVAIAVSILLTRGMLAQDQVPLGFVTKLGIDVDVRSGARILADETLVGTVILPDQAGAPQERKSFRNSSVAPPPPALPRER